jgi:hypothetical protein
MITAKNKWQYRNYLIAYLKHPFEEEIGDNLLGKFSVAPPIILLKANSGEKNAFLG